MLKEKRVHDGCIKHKFESFFYVLQFIIYRHNSLPFFLYMIVCTFEKGLFEQKFLFYVVLKKTCLNKTSSFAYFEKGKMVFDVTTQIRIPDQVSIIFSFKE